KRLPTTLSCSLGAPGGSAASAARQAGLALVPVPHGERSYALPGQSTNERASAPSAPGANSSTWSISAPPVPVTPAAASASLTRQAKPVSASSSRVSTRSPKPSTGSVHRKNQLPPQATSPVTRTRAPRQSSS